MNGGDIGSGPWHLECCLGHDSHKISPWSPRCKLALHFIAPTQTWTIKAGGEEKCNPQSLLQATDIKWPSESFGTHPSSAVCLVDRLKASLFYKVWHCGVAECLSLCQEWRGDRVRLWEHPGLPAVEGAEELWGEEKLLNHHCQGV